MDGQINYLHQLLEAGKNSSVEQMLRIRLGRKESVVVMQILVDVSQTRILSEKQHRRATTWFTLLLEMHLSILIAMVDSSSLIKEVVTQKVSQLCFHLVKFWLGGSWAGHSL